MPELLVDMPGLQVSRAERQAHLVLHCRPQDADALGAAGEFRLPRTLLRADSLGRWSLLHLAPDEWLLLGPETESRDLIARFAAMDVPHALVDVTDRSLGLDVSGPAATALLNAGCPLDLGPDAFPPRACTRTLFGKVTVLLWRVDETEAYRIEYTRSFDDYVATLVRTAAPDVIEQSIAPQGEEP